MRTREHERRGRDRPIKRARQLQERLEVLLRDAHMLRLEAEHREAELDALRRAVDRRRRS